MAKSPLVSLIADSDCPKCGGPVGSHSDMCLDCGWEQPLGFVPWLIALGFAAFMVFCVYMQGAK